MTNLAPESASSPPRSRASASTRRISRSEMPADEGARARATCPGTSPRGPSNHRAAPPARAAAARTVGGPREAPISAKRPAPTRLGAWVTARFPRFDAEVGEMRESGPERPRHGPPRCGVICTCGQHGRTNDATRSRNPRGLSGGPGDRGRSRSPIRTACRCPRGLLVFTFLARGLLLSHK